MSDNVPSSFQIVRLDGYSDRSKNNLAIVPNTWIEDCDDSDNFKVKYMEPSGDAEDDASIRGFVENPLPSAPVDWPKYVCYPQAEASCYNEALLILSSLKKADRRVSQAKSKPRSVKKNAKVLSDHTNVTRVTSSDGSIITSVETSNLEVNLKSFPNMEVYVEQEEEQSVTPSLVLSNPQQDSIISGINESEGDASLIEVSVNRENDTAKSSETPVRSPTKQANSRTAKTNKRKSAENDEKDDSSDDEFMSNAAFKKYVIKKLKSMEKNTKVMKVDLSNLALEVHETKVYVVEENRVAGKSDILPFEEFCTTCKLDLPLEDIGKFDEFNTALVDTKKSELRESLVKYLDSNISTVGNVERNIRLILRKFIHKAVASKVTAKKPMPQKQVLNDTEFGKILKNCFVKRYNDANKLNERSFLLAMGNILNNVKDWDGGRKEATV